MPDRPLPGPDLEELLLDTLDCVARAKAGRLQALEAAIEGGGLLKMARQMTLHGDWIVWLEKAGLNRRTANDWIRLSDLEMPAEQVLERGGMRAVLKDSARKPNSQKSIAAQLKQAGDRVGAAKKEYYAALTERRRLLRERERQGES